MDITRWDPLKELEAMSRNLSRTFGRSLARPEEMEPLVFTDWTPLVDIEETDKEYLVKAELPDVAKQDVSVEVRDDVLYIRGERRKEKEEKGKKYHRMERTYGKFLRSFAMPEDVDGAQVTADFKEGVLHVKLPKAPMAKAKTFEVKVA
jgi:HSP20 family protein